MTKPTDLFCKYSDIYAEQFAIYPDEVDNEYCLTLTENDRLSKLRRLTINNVPKNTLLLPLQKYSKLDIGLSLKEVLKSDPGVFKCCDYLLISMVNDKLYLIYIEMKSNKVVPSEVIKQFKAATCFINYCNAIIEHFYNTPLTMPLTVNVRYVLITKGTRKESIKHKSYEKHSSPDKFAHAKVRISDENKKSATVSFGTFL